MSVKPLFPALVLCLACGSAQTSTTGDPTPDPPGAQSGTATAAEGVTPLELACEAGSAERCDALDDDCDGAIDEGCGYGGGAVSIVATWGDESDLDLVVTSQAADDFPTPELHSGRGGCAPDEAHPRIESAAWAEPLTGELRISLTHVDDCAEETPAADDGEEGAPAATPSSVSIALGGEVVGTYNVTIEPGATVEVATIALTH